MPRFSVTPRKFLVTIHFMQSMPPHKIDCRKKVLKKKSPLDAAESIIWHWREDPVEDRIYPDDIQLVVVVDKPTETLWAFIPKEYHEYDIETGKLKGLKTRWKRIVGPAFKVWKEINDIK